jgi:hypothetical protein
MDNNVFAFGTSPNITVPAGGSIAVYTIDKATVYQVVGFPNEPTKRNKLGVVSNGQTVFGSYASGATIVIEAQAAPVKYVVGTSPQVDEVILTKPQPTPTALTVAATLTPAQILTGIITGTHTAGATQAYTLPTGTLMDASLQLAVNDSFDWVLICLSAATTDTITLTAATGHTIVGNAIVQSANAASGGIWGNSAQFRTVKTAANTFVTYRIS